MLITAVLNAIAAISNGPKKRNGKHGKDQDLLCIMLMEGLESDLIGAGSEKGYHNGSEVLRNQVKLASVPGS